MGCNRNGRSTPSGSERSSARSRARSLAPASPSASRARASSSHACATTHVGLASAVGRRGPARARLWLPRGRPGRAAARRARCAPLRFPARARPLRRWPAPPVWSRPGARGLGAAVLASLWRACVGSPIAEQAARPLDNRLAPRRRGRAPARGARARGGGAVRPPDGLRVERRSRPANHRSASSSRARPSRRPAPCRPPR